MNAQIAPERSADIGMLRVPPHAIEAEQAVLGGLMLRPEALPQVSDWLREDDFYRKDHRLIWRAIVALIDIKAPVDAVTLGDWFETNGLAEAVGGIAYVSELANTTPSAANLVAYAEIVVEKSRLRSAIDVGLRMSEAAYGQQAESQRIVAHAAHLLSGMQVSRTRGGLQPAKQALAKMHQQLIERYQRGPGLIGLPWPWEALNGATKGLRDGVLYIVAARPSMGKTVFGLQTAVHVALAGHRTAVFSVEMTEDELMARAVSCVGRIPHDWVESPAQEHDDAELFWTRLTEATAALKACPLLIDETPSLRREQLVARARRAHMQQPLRLIVLDHLHDMGHDDDEEKRHAFANDVQEAKTLAKELRCPVIMLAQLNRQISGRNNKRPVLTDLRESGAIEEKADVVLFLHREDYYEPNTHLRGLVEVIPAKGRNMRVGHTIHLANAFDEMRLDDWFGPIPEAPEVEHVSRRGRGISARKPQTWFGEKD
jgi:replicative DNA helicase